MAHHPLLFNTFTLTIFLTVSGLTNFPESTSLKVNVIAELEFRLAYYDVTGAPLEV